jgi:hypothetical protein
MLRRQGLLVVAVEAEVEAGVGACKFPPYDQELPLSYKPGPGRPGYHIPELEAKAGERLAQATMALLDAEDMWTVISSTKADKVKLVWADRLFDKVVHLPAFRDWVATKPDYLYSLMKRAAVPPQMQSAVIAASDVEDLILVFCPSCRIPFMPARKLDDGTAKCIYMSHSLSADVVGTALRMWVE